MSWSGELWQLWTLWRRLDRIHRALWTAVRHPDRITRACERLAITENELLDCRRLLLETRPWQDRGPTALVSKPGRWDVDSADPQQNDRLIEQARRQIVYLLELPVTRQCPALASRFVLQLVQAAVSANENLQEKLTEALRLAHQASFGEVVSNAGWHTSEHDGGIEQVLEASELKDATAEAREDRRSDPGSRAAVRRLFQSFRTEAPLVSWFLDALDELEALATPAELAARPLARRHLHLMAQSVTAELAARTALAHVRIEKVLDSIAHHVLVPLSELSWVIDPCERRAGSSGAPTCGGDHPWTLLARLALLKLSLAIEPSAPARGNDGERILFVRGAAITPDGEHPIPPPLKSKTWAVHARWLMSSEYFRSNPRLALLAAGEICRNGALPSWEACLRLANGQVSPYRYVIEPSAVSTWEVMIDIRQEADGSLVIPFSVTHQPLPQPLRDQFEGAELEERIRILWHLVEAARDFRTAARALSVTDVQRQIGMRQAELLARVGARA